MNANDVAGEGLGLVSRLAGAAISVPVVAGFGPARRCRARRSVAPRRRAQAARSQAGSTAATQGRVEKRGWLRSSRLGYYDHDGGDHPVVYFGEPIRAGHFLIRCAGRCAA